MALNIWNGASWTAANRLKVWNGTSWVDCAYGKVWNGASWVEFFSGYSAQLISDSYTRIATPSSFQVNTNGYVYAASGGTQQFVQKYQWLTGIGAGIDYEIRADLVTTNGTPSGSSFGTWISLNSTAQWNIGAIAGQLRYFSMDVQIRQAVSQVVLAGPVNVYVECDRS